MADFEEKEPFERIGVEEAKALMEKGVKVIDVREPSEWEQGRIPNATHIPLNTPRVVGHRASNAAPSAHCILY